MINRGLETFQLLLLEKHGNNRVAASVMDDKVASLSNTVHVLQLLKALELTSQTVFPVTDENSNNMKLIGSILRKDIFSFLRKLFKYHNMVEVIYLMLPQDRKDYDDRKARKIKKITLGKRGSRIKESMADGIENAVHSVGLTRKKTVNFLLDPFSFDRSEYGRRSPDTPMTPATPPIADTDTPTTITNNINNNTLNNDITYNANTTSTINDKNTKINDKLHMTEKMDQKTNQKIDQIRSPLQSSHENNSCNDLVAKPESPIDEIAVISVKENEERPSILNFRNGSSFSLLDPVRHLNGERRRKIKIDIDAPGILMTSYLNDNYNNTNDINNKDNHENDSFTREKSVFTAASVWSAVNIAAHSFMRESTGMLGYRDNPNEIDESERVDIIEGINLIEMNKQTSPHTPELLTLFALEVVVDAELSLHLNRFPFRYV